MMKRAMAMLMAVVALQASAACGSDNNVGNKALRDIKEQANNRLGETTTTTAKAGNGATATTATTAPKATQTVREIEILGGAAGEQFEPITQTAYVGSVIRWINKDSVPRSVKADSGQFASPMIAPGASWDYAAGTVGVFDYSDDTRPYVKGQLQVLAKP